MRRINFLILTTIFIFLSSCNRKDVTGTVVSNSKTTEEQAENPYIEGNKNIMRRENEEITLFLTRYGWEMQRSGTGLYYKILDEGKGNTFQENDRINLIYKTFLLSGEKVYDSDSLGMKSFVVNRSEEIDALHEIATQLRPGAKAILIIPSYLAYGVAGDGDMIAGLQPIIMEIKVADEDDLKNKSLKNFIN